MLSEISERDVPAHVSVPLTRLEPAARLRQAYGQPPVVSAVILILPNLR
jgi:hypothetical protein